jgi:hypothetical protein
LFETDAPVTLQLLTDAEDFRGWWRRTNGFEVMEDLVNTESQGMSGKLRESGKRRCEILYCCRTARNKSSKSDAVWLVVHDGAQMVKLT